MDHDDLQHLPYVIVRLKQQQMAISSKFVRQLVLMPKVVAIPAAPAVVRGVIELRARTMPLVDLRVLLGMPSLPQENQETIQTLHEREQDHRNWLTELQVSVAEKRIFALARDPHKCKFGKWYDTFKPENRSVAFLSLWQSFDHPHCRIHAIADKVLGLAAKGDHAGAQGIIDAARGNELKQLVGLFDSARRMLGETGREVAAVLERQGRRLAVAVDEVTAIETLDDAGVEAVSGLGGMPRTALTPYVARRPSSGQIVLVLDLGQLFGSCGSSRAA